MSITDLLESYLDGSLMVRDLISSVSKKIEESDPRIWISFTPKHLLEDWLLRLESSSPEDLPLYGIPFAIKDNIDLAGVPTTAACPDYAYTPSENAFVVDQLIEAGAIPMGKTNLDQFATGLVGVRSPYGVPPNPFNPDYIPGGSSSGSAVAVANDLVAFSLGTDTAGSGRIPAGLNELIGLKPTRGLLSCSGVIPACRTLDCVSIFAQSADDAELVLDVAGSFDPADSYARPESVSLDFPEAFTFGIPSDNDLEFFGNEEAAQLFQQAIQRLEQIGGQSQVIDFTPFRNAALLLYEGPWVAERFVAIEEILKERPEILFPVTRAIIEGGGKASAADSFKAQYRLSELKRQADCELAKVDFVLTPTAGTAYSIAEVEADPVRLNSNLGHYTNFMNLLDYSACAFPAGRLADKGDLPWGVTAFAPPFSDRALLSVASAFSSGESISASSPDGWTSVVVCGAHMGGLPLNHQLTDRDGRFDEATTTASHYRFYALPPVGDIPPRPGLICSPDDPTATAIDVEVWSVPTSAFGSFVAGIPSPLGIGKIELSDGRHLPGFICEPYAIKGAVEITELRSWRKFLDQ